MLDFILNTAKEAIEKLLRMKSERRKVKLRQYYQSRIKNIESRIFSLQSEVENITNAIRSNANLFKSLADRRIEYQTKPLLTKIEKLKLMRQFDLDKLDRL